MHTNAQLMEQEHSSSLGCDEVIQMLSYSLDFKQMKNLSYANTRLRQIQI